jgi:hypothetical protein
MEVVTKMGQLDDYLGKTFKPSEITEYGESIKGLIERRHVFLRGEVPFVALRSMNAQGRLHCYRFHVFITQPISEKGYGVLELMKSDEVFEFMKQGGNFKEV